MLNQPFQKRNSLTLYQTVIAILLFSIVGYLYLNGVNGAFYYDDYRPLSNLALVTDLQSSLIYVFSEISGPLGRPISMLTFLFNVNDWPNNLNAFFTFNIGLHLLNGILVFFSTYWLAYLFDVKSDSNLHSSPYVIAILASLIWLVLPINVSTSLIAIQRMAGLSAFFLFLGVTLYVYGLTIQFDSIKKIKKAQVFQGVGLILLTPLAILAKENGMLLPVLVLVTEITLLRNIEKLAEGRNYRLLVGKITLLIIIIYLVVSAIKAQNFYPGREFTLVERLLTQPQILLNYLKLAFIPEVTKFNPFYDNYQHVSSAFSSLLTSLSIFIWFILLGLALLKRKTWAVYSFAVLWFVAAHILESTVLGLELYFQHRNYVALVGPCIALSLFFAKVPSNYKKYAILAFSLYWLILAFNLKQTANLWGNQGEAAKSWFLAQKGSSRAAEHLALIYLQHNQIHEALAILEQQVNLCPNCMGSKVQALLLSCVADEKNKTSYYYKSILNTIHSAKIVGSSASALQKLHEQVDKKQCKYLNLTDLKKLNNLLMRVQDSSFNKKLAFIINLHQIAMLEGDKEENIRLLKLAYLESNSLDIANILITHLLKNKNFVEASNIANTKICSKLPWNPLLRAEALSNCMSIKSKTNTYIHESKVKHTNLDELTSKGNDL